MQVSFWLIVSIIIVNTKVKKNDIVKKSQQEHKVKNDKEKIVKPISQSKPIIEQKAINQQNQQSQTIPFTQQTQQTEEITSELPKENAISKGSVGNIKESAVNRKIPTSLQRDVYKQVVRKYILCTI